MENFKIVLERNESEEMFEEWETTNFKWPFDDVVLEAQDIDDAADEFIEKYKNHLNRDWDIEGSDNEIVFFGGNTEDGLSLVFRITKQ
ncbi:hypothetical protein V4V35_25490 [Bacillus infantis]|uniref:hypothetical protein n=1 Tax=Bacillus infantis TaxID=324767 RepID=UPI002FBEB6C1